MTPLPRWVLLLVSLLVAAVVAHPAEHACVRLCRARYTSPEFAGVCEHQQRPVLQSGGGRFPIQRLFTLCLTPCHGSDHLDSILYDTTDACLAFRDTLIRRLSCTCDSPSHDENLEEHQIREADGWKMLRVRADPRAMAHADSRHRQRSGIESLSETIEKTMEGEGAIYLRTSSPTVEPGIMDETSIDWEMWCRIQCDNGQGGSACQCDIIP